MKTLLILSIIGLATVTYSQKVVALHSAGTVTMFNTNNPFQDAYSAAVNGDTLYLPGGSMTPPTTIDKQLVIIGAGFHADSTTATYPTNISSSFSLGENADFTILEGLKINGNISALSNVSASNVQLRRCSLTGYLNFPGSGATPTENFVVEECVIGGSSNVQNFRNCLFTNTVFVTQLYYSYSNLIQNCIFLRQGGASSSAGGRTVYNSYNNSFANNIFYNTTIYSVYGDANTFENNLFCNATPELGSSPITVNNYLGVPQASVFVNEPDYLWSESDDHHLQDPVTYIGTDAAPIGIYGGYSPFKAGAVPHNPHISSKTIAPQTNASGQLNVQITTSAQDN